MEHQVDLMEALEGISLRVTAESQGWTEQRK